MFHSRNVKKLLEKTILPIETIDGSSYSIQSTVLLSCKTGSIISYVNSPKNHPTYNNSLNNIRMMALLIKDKWSEDESDVEEQNTFSCYHESYDNISTRIYTYELEDLHTCVSQIPDSELLLLFIGESTYPYGLLAMKMKIALRSFTDIYGYKLE